MSGEAVGAARLARLLAEVSGGVRPTSAELAELLWLAGQMEAPESPTASAASLPARPEGGPRPASVPPPEPASPHPLPGPAAPPPAEPKLPHGRVPLRLPGAGAAGGPGAAEGSYTPLLAPAPPMLSHPLALQRALRPLKRRVPAPVGQELDEEATAHRIARLGAAPQWWLPVLRPATERWLTLHLVYDAGPTMPVWRPLVRELHTALTQSGIFRTVELHRLDADGTVRRPGSQESYAAGRTVTLLVSDCMGPQWRESPAATRWYGTLRRWAAGMPVALVQPLPERLWRTTALPATTARIAAPWPAAPNAAYDVDSSTAEDLPSGALPLPVLEASAPWLANWSALVTDRGRLPGSVALLGPAPPPAPTDEHGRGDAEQLTPEELVLRFRSLASPEAFRLAGHLAVGRPELPVMRLVQAAIEPNPQPQHLAEVILSGVLSTTPGPPGSYTFRPGVRELLLGTLPRTAHGRTAELLGRVGALIDARAGVSAGEFRVLAPGDGAATAGGEPFAAVREESVRRLGGAPPRQPTGASHEPEPGLARYRLEERLGWGKQVLRAQDTRSGRTVAVYPYSAVKPERHQRFLDAARSLSAVRSDHVISVEDFGIEDGTPYLVTEFVEGVTLADLTAEGGFRLPYWLLAPLAHQVAKGLAAVHTRGLAHGRLTPNSLLVRPDGTFTITHFALGNVRGRDESKDLDDFGHLLVELSGGLAAPGPGERATELPATRRVFRARFGEVVNALLSPNPDEQRRGRDRLLSPAWGDVVDAATSDEYRYQLLGPVRIDQGDRVQHIAPARAQALLCMLLLRHGRSVTFGELTEGIWGQHRQHLQEGPGQLLSTYASALRKALGPGVLATTPDGYALHARPRSIDVNYCDELVATAESHRANGDLAAARDAVLRALGLWQGDSLDGVPGPAARTARTRLQARRLALCVTRAELDLKLGDFEQAATDLTELLREHPENKDLRRLHILALNRELRPAQERDRATIVVEFADPGDDRQAHSVLGRTLTWLLSLSDLAPDQYEVLARDNGCAVITEPDVSVLPVLPILMRELPGALLELDDPPQVRVTFWHTAQFADPDRPPGLEAALADSATDVVLVLSPVLHEELANSDLPVDPGSFRPVHGPAPDGPPLAWYCPLELPERAPVPEPVQRDLVRGPFTTHDLRAIGAPEPGRAAVVHTRPDGSLTLLNPDSPHGKRTSWPRITYYEVDLTPHQAARRLSLPSSGGGAFAADVELSWHVDDPVAFVRDETTDVSGRLLEHLVKEAGRITRRHPLRRAGAAQQAVHEGLRRWPVPGLSVACSVRLAPEGETVRELLPEAPWAAAPAPALVALLAGASSVLLGFDGPLTRLYSPRAEEEVTRHLVDILVESSHPDEALNGQRLLETGTPGSSVERRPNPLDLLRTVRNRGVGADLCRALERLEQRAVHRARPTAHAEALLRFLGTVGRGSAVIADNSPRTVTAFLEARGLIHSLTGGVHGRTEDTTELMPNPDCLLRALGQLDTPPSGAVLIGSSVAELTAANSIGLRFIGFARDKEHERHLRRAGCIYQVTSLETVIKALHPG